MRIRQFLISTVVGLTLLSIPYQANSSSLNNFSNVPNYHINLHRQSKEQRLEQYYQRQQRQQFNRKIANFKKRHPHTIVHIIKPKPIRPNARQVKLDLRQMRQQTLTDINHERLQHHRPKIIVNQRLTKLANLRAQQISQHFSHYNSKGHPMTSVDATKVHLPRNFQGSENIASTSLGRCKSIEDPKTYNNHNGIQMANMTNDSMMNYDNFEQNGHRKNILSKQNRLIGIGTSYSAKKHTFYLVEDFGSYDMDSSEDVDSISQQRLNHNNLYKFAQQIKILWNQIQKSIQHTFSKLSKIL